MCAFVGPASLPRPLYDAVLPGGSVFPGWRLAALLLLLAQQVDLSQAIEELIEDIEAGRKYMKTYVAGAGAAALRRIRRFISLTIRKTQKARMAKSMHCWMKAP